MIILAGLLPLQLVVYSFFFFNSKFADTIYYPYIFKPISNFINPIVGLFDLALLDLMIVLLILFVLFIIIKLVLYVIGVKNKLKDGSSCIDSKSLRTIINPSKIFGHFILKTLAIISVVYALFLWSWGFNYYRSPLQKTLDYNTKDIAISELEDLARHHLKLAKKYRVELNEDSNGVMTFPNRSEWVAMSKMSFDPSATYFKKYPEFKIWAKNNPPVIKELYLSKVLSALATSGIYNVFTTEANVNIDQLDPMIPLVACHEISHQVGVAPENEANFIGFVAAREHPDHYYKYSASLFAVRYLLSAIAREDYVRAVILHDHYSPEMKRDVEAMNKYWKGTQSKIQKLSQDIYDYYLKLNSQKDGRKSYGQVVSLMIGEARKRQEKR